MYQIGIGIRFGMTSASALATANGVMQNGKNRISSHPALFISTI